MTERHRFNISKWAASGDVALVLDEAAQAFFEAGGDERGFDEWLYAQAGRPEFNAEVQTMVDGWRQHAQDNATAGDEQQRLALAQEGIHIEAPEAQS